MHLEAPIQTWSDETIAQLSAEDPQTIAGPLMDAVFAVARSNYSKHKFHYAVKVLRSALANEGPLLGAFLKRFRSEVQTLLKTGLGSTGHGEVSPAVILLRLSWIILREHSSSILTKEAVFASLAQLQAGLLHRVIGSGYTRLINIVLNECAAMPHDVYEAFLKFTEKSTPNPVTASLAAILVRSKSFSDENVAKFSELYLNAAFGKSGPVDPLCFGPFIKSLTAEQFQKHFISVIAKHMKRMPSIAVPTFASMLPYITTDISSSLSSLGLIDMLVAQTRDPAIYDCISLVAKLCSNGDDLLPFAQDLIKRLSRTASPYVYQRVGAVNGLGCLCRASTGNKLMTTVVDALISACKTENVTDVRRALFDAIGQWVHERGLYESEAMDVMIAGVETNAQHALSALYTALFGPHSSTRPRVEMPLPIRHSALAQMCVKMLKSATSKGRVLLPSTSLLTFRILVSVCDEDEAASLQMIVDGMRRCLDLPPVGPIGGFTVVDDWVIWAEILHELFSRHWNVIKGSGDALARAWMSLILGNHPLSRLAVTYLDRVCTTASHDLICVLYDALEKAVMPVGTNHVTTDELGPQCERVGAVYTEKPSVIAGRALRAIIHTSAPSSLFCRAFILSHHPHIDIAWDSIASCWTGIALTEATQAASEAAFSGHHIIRQLGRRAMVTIAATDPSVWHIVHDAIIPTPILHLTRRDVRIYDQPTPAPQAPTKGKETKEQRSRKEKLREEAAIRHSVTELHDRVVCGLAVGTALIRAGVDDGSAIVVSAYALLRSSLTRNAAARAIMEVGATVIPSKLLASFIAMTASLLDGSRTLPVLFPHESKVKAPDLADMLTVAIHGVSSLDPSPILSWIIMPLIRMAVDHKTQVAVTILTRHADAADSLLWPVQEITAALIQVIDTGAKASIPQKIITATPVIGELASSLLLSADPLTISTVLTAVESASPGQPLTDAQMEAFFAGSSYCHHHIRPFVHLKYPRHMRAALTDGTVEESLLHSTAHRRFAVTLFVLQFAQCSQADQLWNSMEIEMDDRFFYELCEMLCLPASDTVVGAIGHAIAESMQSKAKDEQYVLKCLQHLFQMYSDHKPVENAAPERLVVEFEQVLPNTVPSDAKDTTDALEIQLRLHTRRAFAKVMVQIAPLAPGPQCWEYLFKYLINEGLCDEDEDVRSSLIEAGVAGIVGGSQVSVLLPMFDSCLASPAKSVMEDRVQEGVVVFTGSLAKHMDPNDEHMQNIIYRLVDALETPSEAVQQSVSLCIHPLINSRKDLAPDLIKLLMDRLMTKDTYGQRRGAAFGLAGVVKGLGIGALKQHDIMSRLLATVQEKSSTMEARQGSLLAFECLSILLGRLFEPYVIQILPLLLMAYGESSTHIRRATEGASRAVMGQLSGHGVKLVLPALMRSLDDRAWRTRHAGVELLGAMAFCAPKQLSACLPSVVPKLTDVMADTHPKVRDAGKEALASVGSVIRNPEIQSHVPVVLDAVCNPSTKTMTCLEALLDTEFIHVIDPASLALIFPVLLRGLRERSTETKKKAAQIVGNMCILADPKDVTPYVSIILPELQAALVDPIPEVRAVAARAAGSLVRGVGESMFADFVKWLLETIRSDAGTVERSGAAQGLSEVMAALGTERIDALLPGIIESAKDDRIYVREGVQTLFAHLQQALGSDFRPYVSTIISVTLLGLADESESVREASMLAGRAMVQTHGLSELETLLPSLKDALVSPDWRIRGSSVQLLGDLLYLVSGASGKAYLEGQEDTPDEEGVSTEAHSQAIIEALGIERRNSLLAMLYVLRNDVWPAVRTEAVHVWKSVVVNTPRTLKEIMPSLLSSLLVGLASEHLEHRHVAARSLGDVVRKLGDRVLPDLVPVLESGLNSDEATTRQGICIGLGEIIDKSGKNQLAGYVDAFIPALRRALCDPLPEVRQAAAGAYETLQDAVGSKAVTDIVAPLLESISSAEGNTESSRALDGICEILSIKGGKDILAFIIPRLLETPIAASRARALGALASVASSTMHLFIGGTLPALLQAASETDDSDTAAAIKDALVSVTLSVGDEGVFSLYSYIYASLGHSDYRRNVVACEVLATYVANTKSDFSSHTASLLEMLVQLLCSESKDVVFAAYGAVSALVKKIKKEDLPSYMAPVITALSRTAQPLRAADPEYNVPGFCLPRGLAPLVSIFVQGLMFGSAESRQKAADGMTVLVDLTSPASLAPFVVSIAGPLIRVIGDRFPASLKAAILRAMRLLLKKGGPALRPFLPQLQTTFLKALNESTRVVRVRAAGALGQLSALTPRLDPLVNEVINTTKSPDTGIAQAAFTALAAVIESAGVKLSAAAKTKLVDSLAIGLTVEADRVRGACCVAFGEYSQLLDGEGWTDIVTRVVLNGWLPDDTDVDTKAHTAGRALCLVHFLKHINVPDTADIVEQIMRYACVELGDSNDAVRLPAARSASILLKYVAHNDVLSSRLILALSPLTADPSTDVRRYAILALKRCARAYPTTLEPHLPIIVPRMLACVKEKNLPAKLAAERVLMYALRIKEDNSVVQSLTEQLDAATGKALSDYVRRVLVRVARESSGEISSDEDEDEGDELLVGEED